MGHMIFFKKPIFYLKKAWGLCGETTRETDVNRITLMFDLLFSSIRYNVSLRQFFKSDFYKKEILSVKV